MDSIRLVLAIATSNQWNLHHMDVKSSFIHGDLKDEIYFKKPQGFFSNLSLMCKLKKSIYGLKQAPKSWYANIYGFLLSMKFSRCKSDPNVYLKLIHLSIIIIIFYVDDLLSQEVP